MADKRAVVVGARGTTGRNVVEALEAAGGWEVVGLSRGAPGFDTNATFIAVDLEDERDAEAKLSGLTDVTHVFYCGLAGGFEAENIEGNLALVKNSIGILDRIAPGLERVTLTQGGKYYGCHLGPYKRELYTKVTKTSLTAPSLCYNILLDQEDMTWQTRPQASISEKVSP